MFSEDDGYKYQFKTTQMVQDVDIFYKRYVYTFKSRKNETYIVHVDEFEEMKLCAIKFFLKAHKDSENKYQMKTNMYEMPSIISTCINIMVAFYNEDTFRSFGFIGMNDIGESIENTKRFKLYKHIILARFSPNTFKHLESAKQSVYLMLNIKHQITNSNLAADISSFLNDNYEISIG